MERYKRIGRRVLIVGVAAAVFVGCRQTKTDEAPQEAAAAEQQAELSWQQNEMPRGRAMHEMVRLEDGRVLVVGGYRPGGDGLAKSATVYDPAAQTWSELAAPSQWRKNAALVLLSDGRVLYFGGVDDSQQALASAEIYDPDTDAWSAAAAMPSAREAHSATVLDDGRVLVIGGADGSSKKAALLDEVLIYDPAADTWTPSTKLGAPRAFHVAERVGDKVIVAGGIGSAPGGTQATKIALQFDPSTQTWSKLPGLAVDYPVAKGAVLDGERLLVWSSLNPNKPAQLWQPDTQQWEDVGAPAAATPIEAGAAVPSGPVARVGPKAVAVFESGAKRWLRMPEWATQRDDAAVLRLEDGSVLVTGGATPGGEFASSSVRCCE